MEIQTALYHSMRCWFLVQGPHAYGTSTICARQKANFLAVGSSTLTWHVYRPACNLAIGTLNLTGSALIWRELAAEGRHWEVVKSFGRRKGLDRTCCVVDFRAWREYGGSGVRTDTGWTGSTHRGDLTANASTGVG